MHLAKQATLLVYQILVQLMDRGPVFIGRVIFITTMLHKLSGPEVKEWRASFIKVTITSHEPVSIFAEMSVEFWKKTRTTCLSETHLSNKDVSMAVV